MKAKANEYGDGLITTSKIGGRGWTYCMRERFYPVPFSRRVNPRHPNGPFLRLYLLAEVLRIEATPEFREAMAARAARRAA